MDKWMEKWLEQNFILPLCDKGLKFKGYGHTVFEMEDAGVHTLMFGYSHREIPKEFFTMIEDILIQDDDNQPNSTYQTYFGTLWVFIPYHA